MHNRICLRRQPPLYHVPIIWYVVAGREFRYQVPIKSSIIFIDVVFDGSLRTSKFCLRYYALQSTMLSFIELTINEKFQAFFEIKLSITVIIVLFFECFDKAMHFHVPKLVKQFLINHGCHLQSTEYPFGRCQVKNKNI